MADIFDDFRRLEENMNRMFDELWGQSRRFPLLPPVGSPLLLPAELEKRQIRPYIDLVETDKELIATVDLPGLNKEDIKINIIYDRLEVSGETKQEEEKKEKGYVYKERRSGSFYRAISLPSKIDPDNVKASYNNGVLEVKMPKVEIKEKKAIKVE